MCRRTHTFKYSTTHICTRSNIHRHFTLTHTKCPTGTLISARLLRSMDVMPPHSRSHHWRAAWLIKQLLSAAMTICLSSLLSSPLRSFMEMMEARGKGYNSPGPTNGQSPSSGSQSPVVPPGAASPNVSSPSTPQAPLPPQTQPIPVPHPTGATPRAPPQAAAAPQLATPTQAGVAAASPSALVQRSPVVPPGASSPTSAAAAAAAAPPQKRGFISRLFGGSAATEQALDKPGEYKHTHAR